MMWLHDVNRSGNVSLNSINRSIHVECNSITTIFISQSWGDHTDELQAAFVYICATGIVCLYCWLGNELSEQVRIIIFSNQKRIYLSRNFYESNIFRLSSILILEAFQRRLSDNCFR